MIPVKITQPLYIRKGAGTSFDKIGVIQPSGKTILMDGVVENGEALKGITKWYYKINDNQDKQYYWGGRIQEDLPIQNDTTLENINTLSPLNLQAFIDERFDGKNLSQVINYNSLLELSDDLKNSAGQNVIVAILDHPISLSIKVTNDIIRPFHVSEPLINFHGNFITGLIGGFNKIVGAANKAQIVELPIYNQRANSNGINIEAVLNFIKNYSGPMLVNISNGLDPKYNDIIRNLGTGKIIVSCTGIDEDLSATTIRDPATQSNVLTIGALNKLPSSKQNLNKKVDFILPNYKYVSFNQTDQQYIYGQGDSFACAITTAIISLLISSGRVNYDLDAIKLELSKISLSLSNISSLNSFNLINAKS